jgi:competence protein ComEA
MRLVFSISVIAISLWGADKPKLPEGPGKAATVKLCGTTCHGPELVMNRRESVEGWSGVVEDMIRRGRGSKGSDEEFGEVVDYLVTHFPKTTPVAKVNVNKASANDLAAALAITGEQAAAIVEYRTSKGDFKSIEDLRKVPGIDAAVIDAKKDKLEF